MPWHPQILADQLTLSQLGGGVDYAHQIIVGLRIFRPSNGPDHGLGMDNDSTTKNTPKTSQIIRPIYPNRPKPLGYYSYVVSVVREFKQEKESRDKRFLTTKLHAVNLLC